MIVSTGPVTTVRGSQPVKPAAGIGGRLDLNANFGPYIVPGQQLGQDGVTILNDPFDIAYATQEATHTDERLVDRFGPAMERLGGGAHVA